MGAGAGPRNERYVGWAAKAGRNGILPAASGAGCGSGTQLHGGRQLFVSRGAKLRVCNCPVMFLLDSSINWRWASSSLVGGTACCTPLGTHGPLPGCHIQAPMPGPWFGCCVFPRCSRAQVCRASNLASRSRWTSDGRGDPTSVCCRSAAASAGCCRRSRMRSRISPEDMPVGSGGVPNGGVLGVAALGVLIPSIGSKRALPAWLGGLAGRAVIGGLTVGAAGGGCSTRGVGAGGKFA